MVNLSIRNHPDVLFAYSNNYVEVILRVENPAPHPIWAEADLSVPENLSLSPNTALKKGRVRVGIVARNEFLEKAVRVYSGAYTSPQMYRCNATLYVFNHDGVIDQRMEKAVDIRCEAKKEASL
ncbi:MAG: hypothetical protein PHV13_04310 [Candidatus ainarchaeum sp.]|nr:hypothetical protein [Candidatus ainarchaeum sp.]